jgi:hypothetical protein
MADDISRPFLSPAQELAHKAHTRLSHALRFGTTEEHYAAVDELDRMEADCDNHYRKGGTMIDGTLSPQTHASPLKYKIAPLTIAQYCRDGGVRRPVGTVAMIPVSVPAPELRTPYKDDDGGGESPE